MGRLQVRVAVLLVVGWLVWPAAARPGSNPGESRSTKMSALATAKKAAFELKGTLLKRVVGAMKAGGAPGAVQVCSQEARALTLKVARSHGVRLGRTATRLRNPENAPPAWMKPILAKEAGLSGPQVVQLPTGHGVALPIKTAKPCLRCHGKKADLDPALRAKLQTLYPKDAATGFGRGDLRGWVWVEVPARSALADGVYQVHASSRDKAALKAGAGQRVVPFSQLFEPDPDAEPPEFFLVAGTPDVPLALAEAPKVYETDDGKLAVGLHLTQDAGRQLESFTRSQAEAGARVAVILDGRVATAHKLRTAITGDRLQISCCDRAACEYLIERLAVRP